MFGFNFKHVCIESMALHLPTTMVTSSELEDRIGPLYQRLGIPFGTLERVSGIETRYIWPKEVVPSAAASVAAAAALEKSQLDKSHIKALISCSVTRDYFEPATACMIHNKLGLSEQTLVMDLSNACLGFLNGMMVLGNMIESGLVKAGIIVSGETITKPLEACINHLLKNSDTITREYLIEVLPTFTLGSGAVAYILTHDSISQGGHRLLGGVARSASEHHVLCNGNGDFHAHQTIDFDPMMTTESGKLIYEASKLGGRTWPEVSKVLGWAKDDIKHIVCHQVGRQVNEGFYQEVGLDFSKEFTIYRKYGNLASAALPTALIMAAEERAYQKGDKVMLTGYGSGLNSLFMGIEW